MEFRRYKPPFHAGSKFLFIFSVVCIWELLRSRSLLITFHSLDTFGRTPIESFNPSINLDYQKYKPAITEEYVLEHAIELGYANESDPSGCKLLLDPNATNPRIHNYIQSFESQLKIHMDSIRAFEPIPDLMKSIRVNGNHDICAKARLHPDGLQGIFSQNQLSYSTSGFIEPLLPPMRSLQFCRTYLAALLDLDYLVHDFEAMCRKLKPTSRRILIDLGASFAHHANETQPILELLNLYEKFGFHFDHIYGFEVLPHDSNDVYKNLLPEKYIASYHWINVGIEVDPNSKLNPLRSIVDSFDEDDFIVLKLDIDTPEKEVPLAHQILEDIGGNYTRKIDQFYFEHHVHMLELAPSWLESMHGTIKDSLDLFTGLRRKGIAAHFWP